MDGDIEIEFSYATNLEGSMSKRSQAAQLEKETLQQIELDPVASGERYFFKLEEDARIALDSVNANGENMARAVRLFRLYQGFGHDLAMASGISRYEVRQVFHTRLASDYLRRQYMALKHGGSLPTVEQSPIAAKILAAIRAATPPKAAVFAPVDDYPQPSQTTRPSVD